MLRVVTALWYGTFTTPCDQTVRHATHHHVGRLGDGVGTFHRQRRVDRRTADGALDRDRRCRRTVEVRVMPRPSSAATVAFLLASMPALHTASVPFRNAVARRAAK